MQTRAEEIEAIINRALQDSDKMKLDEEKTRKYVYKKLKEKYGKLITWSMMQDLFIDKRGKL